MECASYQKPPAVLGSHRHCAGAHLASPLTGGRILQSDEEPSQAPAQHMHTVPWLTTEHTPVHTHATATPRCERE